MDFGKSARSIKVGLKRGLKKAVNKMKYRKEKAARKFGTAAAIFNPHEGLGKTLRESSFAHASHRHDLAMKARRSPRTAVVLERKNSPKLTTSVGVGTAAGGYMVGKYWAAPRAQRRKEKKSKPGSKAFSKG